MTLEDVIASMLYVAGLDAQRRMTPRNDRRHPKASFHISLTLLRCTGRLRDQLAKRDLIP